MELRCALDRLMGKPCWSMIGPSAGSWFSLDFGERQRKNRPTPNPKLRPEQREFRGEYKLFVQMTGWNLIHQSKCICDSNSSNAPDGPMVRGLVQLEGKTPLRFAFGKSEAELMIKFTENYRLYLCAWEGVGLEEVAYSLSGEGLRLTVTMDGKMESKLMS